MNIKSTERDIIFFSILPDNGYDENGYYGIREGLDDALDGKPMQEYSPAYKYGYEEGLKYKHIEQMRINSKRIGTTDKSIYHAGALDMQEKIAQRVLAVICDSCPCYRLASSGKYCHLKRKCEKYNIYKDAIFDE